MILENLCCSLSPSLLGRSGNFSPHGHPFYAFHIVLMDFRLLPRYLLPRLPVIMPGITLGTGAKQQVKNVLYPQEVYTIVIHNYSSKPNHPVFGSQRWLTRSVTGLQLRKITMSVHLAYAALCQAQNL